MSNNQLVISFKNSCNLDASFVTAKSMVIAKEQLMELIYDDEIDFIGFKKNKINEKIKIASIENFVVIRHYINFMDFNDYVFQKDDSLLIEYKNKLPIISVLNRKTNKNDFDSEDLYRKRFKFDGYSPIGKYFEALNLFARKLFDDPLMMKSQSKLTRQQIGLRNATGVTEIKKNLFGECIGYLKGYSLFLDSLKNQSLISTVTYQFYKEKVNTTRLFLEFENGDLSLEQTQNILSIYKPNEFGFPELYHQDLLKSIRDKFIFPNVKNLEMNDGRNKDPRDVYERTKQSNLFSEKDKAYLMSREINRIAQLMSKNDFKEYFQRFQKDIKDSILVSNMKKQWFLKLEDENNKTSQTHLRSILAEKIIFEKISSRYKGLTYLDFWASWCAPCRAEMPDSKKLSEEYEKKGINFVYVSIDENAVAWQKASKQIGLPDANSYILPNSKKSAIAKQFNISTIPQYILIGKDGKVINADAPRPSDPKIRKVFDELLKK